MRLGFGGSVEKEEKGKERVSERRQKCQRRASIRDNEIELRTNVTSPSWLPYLRISRKCFVLPKPSLEMCISISVLFSLFSPSFPPSFSPFSTTTEEEGEEDEVEEEGEERKKACSFINWSMWTAAWVLGAREATANVVVPVL